MLAFATLHKSLDTGRMIWTLNVGSLISTQWSVSWEKTVILISINCAPEVHFDTQPNRLVALVYFGLPDIQRPCKFTKSEVASPRIWICCRLQGRLQSAQKTWTWLVFNEICQPLVLLFLMCPPILFLTLSKSTLQLCPIYDGKCKFGLGSLVPPEW